MSVTLKSYGKFKVVKDPIALNARYAVVHKDKKAPEKCKLICEMTQICGDSYVNNEEVILQNAKFIAYCFNLQQKYDIKMLKDLLNMVKKLTSCIEEEYGCKLDICTDAKDLVNKIQIKSSKLMENNILEEFEKAFDEAQNDTECIESSTDEVINSYFSKYPKLISSFKNLMDEKLSWYRNLPD